MNFKLNFPGTALLNRWKAAGGALNVRQDGTQWRFMFAELFVALSLSVAYYFLVYNFAAGSANNYTNGWVFTSCSFPGFHLQQLGDVWKGRLSGLLLSGWMFDFLLTGDRFNIDQFSRLFGLYQSLWLFLLFLMVILALRHSLLINLGIFAGLMYNFSPASGLYFYPWDIPATLFFTLAILFFERRRMFLMAAAACAGCFFKETVLVCALLALFAGHWKWGKRVLMFAGIVAVYVLGKKFLLGQLHIKAAALSMGDATNFLELFRPTILIENFKLLFSPTLNHFIFANAGTLAAVLVLGWRRRFLPYMALIVVFLAGQAMYGGFSEFRIFMQVLPLSLILLSERWQDCARADAATRLPPESVLSARKGETGGGPAGKSPEEPAPAWALRETFPLLLPMAIMLIGLSTGVAAWRYHVIYVNSQPGRRAQTELGKHVLKPEGDASNLETECQMLRAGYADAELELARVSAGSLQLSNAIHHYQRVLELSANSVAALSSLAWLRATASDPGLRNGGEAVRLAERVCDLTHYNTALPVTILAAAYAEAGRFNDALTMAQKARDLALTEGKTEVVARNEEFLALFKSGRAYHQEAKAVP